MLTKWDSPIYREALALRNKVLKESAGQPYLIESPVQEKRDSHLIVKRDDQVVGTLLLHPVCSGCVQIKQVAVDPVCQGKNIGRKLLIYAEQIAENLGFSTLFLTGRKQAWGFYEKMSYQTVFDEYQEGQLILKIFKKDLYPSDNQLHVREMKTNG